MGDFSCPQTLASVYKSGKDFPDIVNVSMKTPRILADSNLNLSAACI